MPEDVPADERAGEFQERFVNIGSSFKPDAKTTEAMTPRVSPFDDPSARRQSIRRLPQYSVPRSVSTRSSGMPKLSKNGTTRSLSRSAAGKGVLRS